jgi:hypothetical protein
VTHLISKSGKAALLLAFVACLTRAQAGTITISVTYATGANAPSAAAQAAFNQVVALFESTYSTPFGNVNVPIEVAFGNIGGNLGQSNTNEVAENYNSAIGKSWLGQMKAAAAAEVNNPYLSAAVSTLPTTNPLGTGSVVLQDALASVLGFTNIGNPLFDSTLTFTNAANTFEYTGTAVSGQYDFMNVAEHELDEALGVGSTLTGLADNAALPTDFAAEDYFRYNSSGQRDVTTDPTQSVYFSYNGSTDVAQFNQANGNGDRNDWAYGCGSPGPLVQDASGCPGVTIQYTSSSPEATVLQTLGYDVVVAPEPGTICLLGAGLAGIGLARRYRKA